MAGASDAAPGVNAAVHVFLHLVDFAAPLDTATPHERATLVLTLPKNTTAEALVLEALAKSLVSLTPLADVYLCDRTGVLLPDDATGGFSPVPPTSTVADWRRAFEQRGARVGDRTYALPCSPTSRLVTVCVLPRPSFAAPAASVQRWLGRLHDDAYAVCGRAAKDAREAEKERRREVSERRERNTTAIEERQRERQRARVLQCYGQGSPIASKAATNASCDASAATPPPVPVAAAPAHVQ